MQSQKRQQKMCWNCEGAVSAEALYCPYCGSDMQIHAETNQKREEELFAQDSFQFSAPVTPSVSQEASNLASLYKPPYSPNQRGFGVPNFKEEKAPEQENFYYPSEQVIYPKQEEPSSKEALQKTDVGLWPLLFLSIGMNLLTLGLLLFFFSDKGKLILEWNSYYWFVYCILAAPLLMFGWKLLQSNTYNDQQ